MRRREVLVLARATILGAVLVSAGCSEPTSAYRPDTPSDTPSEIITRPVTATIQVRAISSGDGIPDRFLVQLDGGEATPIPSNGTISLVARAGVNHFISLGGLGDNCDTIGESVQRTATQTAGDTLRVSFGVSCGTRGPTGRATTQDILFIRRRDIYAVRSDGTDEVRVTNSGTNTGPAWASDGKRLAFVRDRSDTNPAVYTMNLDGSNLVRRSDSSAPWGFASSPAWSPDGKLSYSTSCDGHGCILVTEEGVSLPLRLAHPRGVNHQSAWSPDGSRIAFVSDWTAFDFTSDIYLQGSKGGPIVSLTDGFGFELNMKLYLHPVWSPDGQRIAFLHSSMVDRGVARFTVATMKADGSDIRDLASAGLLGVWGIFDPGSLAWSPDGSRIAFTFVGCEPPPN
jgi:dipeptidyl aminopeptidase/acylaminoacyl peptidase